MTSTDPDGRMCADGRPTTRWRRFRARCKEDRGYVMVMTALLLPVLLGFMAMALDVAVYYYRGVQVQRAADAAALSGVTRMPRFSDARSFADNIAKRNGFQNGVDGIDVQIDRIPNNNKRLAVTITDNAVPLFFGRLIRNNWTISRKATAEYISNIPLGSKENAIGTGYLTDTGPNIQNFWLAVSGPCSPKESGDQFSTRYDGNGVNPSVVTSNDEKFSQLCDVDPSTTNPATQNAYIKAQRDAKTASYANLFPALVANRDYDKLGYNYIVDVPCAPVNGEVLPPPCDSGQTLPGDLVIQVYDPVFNPDSVQRFLQPVSNPGRSSAFTNEVDDRLKPDKYGVIRPTDMVGCTATNLTACRTATIGSNNPAPWDVRVTTDVRVYPPDNSPLDYSDDTGMTLNGNNLVTSADSAVDASEVSRVKRFGSCIRWTDQWTAYATGSTGATNTWPFRSVPPGTGTNSPGTIAGFTNDTTTWDTDAGTATAADCANNADKWVTIAKATVASGAPRGRYRLNIRTVDAVNSFGSNGFAIRAYFVPSGAAETYPACLIAGSTCSSPAQDASVSGDSTMSVFASVNGVSRFYLAKLSPAKLYRNKVVVVSLWDPGEGAGQLQVLRPRHSYPSTNPVETCTVDDTDYCIQSFQWAVGNPNIAAYNTSSPDVGLTTNAAAYADVCSDKGQPVGSDPLPVVLPVAGNYDSVEGCTSSGVGITQPVEIVNSRNFQTDANNRKFNDRLVNVAIKIPANYGCETGTGITDPVSGLDITCKDLEDEGVGLPQEGWWKIKYIPQYVDSSNPSLGYKLITDRTTWTVGLRGDPVHLVPNS